MRFAARRAIILAAGQGFRLAPLTLMTPKPLLAYDGQPIIERIIERVQAAGIAEICIIVGYKAEQFKYLVEKFKGVTLHFNRRWAEGNNVLSVYSALELFDDALVINGDAIVKADIFKKEYDQTTMYADRAVGFSKEWELVLKKDGLIKEIKTGGGVNILQHREATFICAEDFKSFKQAVKSKVEEQRDLDSYFEFCLLPWCEIAVYEVPFGTIFDLDDYRDWVQDPLASKSP